MMLNTDMLRPIIKASVLKNGRDPVERVVIFPCDEEGTLLSEGYIADNAPSAYAWLLRHKAALLGRDKGSFDPRRWYAFGRHTSVTAGFGPKIPTSIMNPYPNFQRCLNPQATLYASYCIKPLPGVDVDALLAALISEAMDFLAGAMAIPTGAVGCRIPNRRSRTFQSLTPSSVDLKSVEPQRRQLTADPVECSN